jgi:hypothetical protein
MIDLSVYASESTIDNIYNQYHDSFGVISNLNIINEGKCFGKVVLVIGILKKKFIKKGSIIKFQEKNVKWSSTHFDDKGCTLHILKAHWCTPFKFEEQLNVPIRILKSKRLEDGTRHYWGEDELLTFTKDQYIERMLLHKYAKEPVMIYYACKNMARRFKEHRDYYRALNETSKHYLIKHERLKSYYGEYQKAKQTFYKNWDVLLLESYRYNKIEKDISEMYNQLTEVKNSKVIPFKS